MVAVYEVEAVKIAAALAPEEILAGLDSRDLNTVLVSQLALRSRGPEAVETLLAAFERHSGEYVRDGRDTKRARTVVASAIAVAITVAISVALNTQFPVYLFTYIAVAAVIARMEPDEARPRMHAVIRGLVAVEDVRLVGALVDAWSISEFSRDSEIGSSLSRLLPRLDAADAATLSNLRLRALAKRLQDDIGEDLCLGILHAIALFGDGSLGASVAPLVRQTNLRLTDAAWARRLRAYPRVQRAAERCMALEHARLAERKNAGTLLRPSDVVHGSMSLLHPVAACNATDPERLLRPADPPTEADASKTCRKAAREL